MAVSDMNFRRGILAAMPECDRLGWDVFLQQRGFRRAEVFSVA